MGQVKSQVCSVENLEKHHSNAVGKFLHYFYAVHFHHLFQQRQIQKTQLRVLSSNSDLREFTSIIINNPSWLVRVHSVWKIKRFYYSIYSNIVYM